MMGGSAKWEECTVREVLPALLAAHNRGETTALATVVRTWRSAPRPAGASMLVTQDGEAVGSVSGGCVEGALYELGTEVLQSGHAHFETYGISDDDAFAVGLTCGGILEVFVEPVSPVTRRRNFPGSHSPSPTRCQLPWRPSSEDPTTWGITW